MSEPKRECGTCRYFRPGLDGTRGECHRGQPLPVYALSATWTGKWPAVPATEWCGEHRFRTSTPAEEAA